jgi:hypothetical protein
VRRSGAGRFAILGLLRPSDRVTEVRPKYRLTQPPGGQKRLAAPGSGRYKGVKARRKPGTQAIYRNGRQAAHALTHAPTRRDLGAISLAAPYTQLPRAYSARARPRAKQRRGLREH